MIRWSVGILLAVSAVGARPVTAQRLMATNTPRESNDVREADALLARRISIRLEKLRLAAAIDSIGAKVGTRIIYRLDVLGRYSAPVSLRLVDVPLADVFDRVLAGTALRVVPANVGRLIIVERSATENAVASGILVGKVVDATRKTPIVGATVLLDGSTRGVQTADDGTFRIPDVAVGSHTVTVRHVGYSKAVHTVVITDGASTTLNVTLEQSTNTLDQVVVTGTVAATELKAVPTAITVITAKQLEERGITRIDQLFRGDVPGLFSANVGSNAGTGAEPGKVLMFSRGVTSLTDLNGTSRSTNPIKTYVDGVEMADPTYLTQIDPKMIERIEILTGPQASTVYGSNALNGVMQIFTKRGSSSRPMVALNLASGLVESRFSDARTPQHDYNAQLSGVDSRVSYSAGATWNYIGPWTPSKQSSQTGVTAGIRFDMPTPMGGVTADATFRRSLSQDRARTYSGEIGTQLAATGYYTPSSRFDQSGPITSAMLGQTFGVTLGYRIGSVWSNELSVGQDAEDWERRKTDRAYSSPSDTSLFLQQRNMQRRSIRYTTTANLPITSFARATVTFGADTWQSETGTVLFFSASALKGSLGPGNYYRATGHNTGSFLQTQVGLLDQLFVTYGLRAEWNPGYGADAQPNLAPRYGAAYTREMGPMTTKLRLSYGRSTRPPVVDLKNPIVSTSTSLISEYGPFNERLANPELGPESQQGGEGGIELYFGSRATLVVTRYNQTIDGLIDTPWADSIRSLAPNPVSAYSRDADGYGYWRQTQAINVGSIRNQGWELQGSVNAGPLTARGTYSWTKSRTIGVNPKYRSYFTPQSYPQFQLGASFRYLPEHTWAAGLTYAHARTTFALNLTGMGQVTKGADEFAMRNLYRYNIRLFQNIASMNGGSMYVNRSPGYAMADLITTQRFSRQVEGVLQLQNLTNYYMNDLDASNATMGRQTKVGLRIHL